METEIWCVPKVIRVPGKAGAATPGITRLSSMNVPFVLFISVTRRLSPCVSIVACTPETAAQKKKLQLELKLRLQRNNQTLLKKRYIKENTGGHRNHNVSLFR